MSNDAKTNEAQINAEDYDEVESALLESDLFVKYNVPHRALDTLRRTIERNPRSIPLRERMRQIAAHNRDFTEAARQCLALANLYIVREEFDMAHDRLLEARQLDERISIASGLEAIRHARRPDLRAGTSVRLLERRPSVVLAGDLSAISIFDAIQTIENSKLTGTLELSFQPNPEELESPEEKCRVLFNNGHIVDAEAGADNGTNAFRRALELTGGSFEFERSDAEFVVRIVTSGNTNLILDSLRQMDEENQDG